MNVTQGKKELHNPKTMLAILEEEELKAFDEIRWRERTSRSELARTAILEYIRQHGDGNDTFKLDQWNINPDLQVIPNIFAADDKHKNDYQSSNKEERNKRFKQVQNILNIYKSVNYESSKQNTDSI